MSWESPSGVIIQLRTQLLLCPSLAAYLSGVYHYPSADPVSDPMPYILLQETDQERRRYAEGAVLLPSGTLLATIFNTTLQPGEFETLLRTVSFELSSQYFGLAIQSVRVGLVSNPTSAAKAESENDDGTQMAYRAGTLTINYGLKA